MLAEKYPLQWPLSFPRQKNPVRSRFGNIPFGKARDTIFKEIRLMIGKYSNDLRSIILSTNIPLKNDGFPYANYKQPEDKGVAVYFKYKKKDIVICCDTWNTIEHNLWAVAKTIEAMRGIERWGVSDFLEHSFQGFTALPPKESDKPKRDWWIILDYAQRPENKPWDWAGVEAQYKSLAKKRHPDMGGSTQAFQELNEAFQQAKKYFGI